MASIIGNKNNCIQAHSLKEQLTTDSDREFMFIRIKFASKS